MTTSSEQAEAHVEELTTKRESWVQKQAQFVSARADLQRNAGAAALEGTPTAKIADQLSRITSEIDIAGQALAALDQQIAAAEVETRVARINDTRAQAVAAIEKHTHIFEAAQPHIDALYDLTGIRYGPVMNYIHDVQRYLSSADYLEYRLPADVRARLQAQRETAPTDVDRAIYKFQYPFHVMEEVAA
jgi:hypothetical protein